MHGMGNQLLAWSEEVRKKLNITMWKGTRKNKIPKERYMNPDTIRRLMDNTN
jgi:hypothetical protein